MGGGNRLENDIKQSKADLRARLRARAIADSEAPRRCVCKKPLGSGKKYNGVESCRACGRLIDE